MGGLTNLIILNAVAKASANAYSSGGSGGYRSYSYKPPVVTTKTVPDNIPEHILNDILCFEHDADHWHEEAEDYISGNYLKNKYIYKDDVVEPIENGVRVIHNENYARDYIIKDGILTTICYLKNSKDELVKSYESTDGQGHIEYNLETGLVEKEYFAPEIIRIDENNVRKIHRFTSYYPDGRIKDKIRFSTLNDERDTEDFKHIQYREDSSIAFKQENNKRTSYDEQNRVLEESTFTIERTYHNNEHHHSTEKANISHYTYYPDTDNILSIRTTQKSRKIEACAIPYEEEIDYQHFKKDGSNDSKKYQALRAVAKKHLKAERKEAMTKLRRSFGVTHRKKNFIKKGSEYLVARLMSHRKNSKNN